MTLWRYLTFEQCTAPVPAHGPHWWVNDLLPNNVQVSVCTAQKQVESVFGMSLKRAMPMPDDIFVLLESICQSIMVSWNRLRKV